MARIIPNKNTWVGFSLTVTSSTGAAQTVTAGTDIAGAVNLTGFLISINASSQGNVVPTPALDTLFETSIIGTSQATFTADFYRDSTADTAWTTLPRGTVGYFVVARFGTAGLAPIAGKTVEIWPVQIVSRTSAAVSNNTVQTFTVTASVPVEPNEASVVL